MIPNAFNLQSQLGQLDDQGNLYALIKSSPFYRVIVPGMVICVSDKVDEYSIKRNGFLPCDGRRHYDGKLYSGSPFSLGRDTVPNVPNHNGLRYIICRL